MLDSSHMRFDCRHRQPRAFVRASVLAAAVMMSTGAFAVVAVASPQHEAAAATASETEAAHGQTLLQSIAKVINFAILGGVLVYFLKTPLNTYLASRATSIRQDLVTASDMRTSASAQLAEIDRKLEALPGELDALKAQGAEDVKAEQARIAQAAAAERERLIAQTRREIEARLRMAHRQLTEHTAELAVQVAEERLKRSITPDDQLRLVDRYAAQLKEAR
jgi:F-type H+-transporting ATPase subunit b